MGRYRPFLTGCRASQGDLWGFSSALSILLSKLCSTHVRNDHDLQQKNGKILNYLNEPTFLREAPGLPKISEDQSEGKQTSMEHRWIPLNKGSRRIHTKLLAGTSEEAGRELGKVGISTFSLKTSALLESLATQRLCFKTQVHQETRASDPATD